MVKYCYKDKSRECDKNCEAYHNSVFYGIDLGGGDREGGSMMRGTCIDLGSKAMVAQILKEIAENLRKKNKK